MEKKNKVLISLIVVAAILTVIYFVRNSKQDVIESSEIAESDLEEYKDSKLNFSMKLPVEIDARFPTVENMTSSIYVISNVKNQTAYLVPSTTKEPWMDDPELTLQKIQEYEADIRARIKFYPILKETDLKAAIQDYYIQSNFKLDSWEEQGEDPSIFTAYFLDKTTGKKIDIGAFFVMKFSADKKRVAIWGLGHEAQFVLTNPKNKNNPKQFDKTMIESLIVY